MSDLYSLYISRKCGAGLGRDRKIAFILPMLMAHKIMMDRNVFYTAVTRAKRRVLLVGQKKALFAAICNKKAGRRNTLLGERMQAYYKSQSIKMAAEQEERLPIIRRAS